MKQANGELQVSELYVLHFYNTKPKKKCQLLSWNFQKKTMSGAFFDVAQNLISGNSQYVAMRLNGPISIIIPSSYLMRAVSFSSQSLSALSDP